MATINIPRNDCLPICSTRTTFRRIRVGIDNKFSIFQQELIKQSFIYLRAFNVDFVYVGGAQQNTDVFIGKWNNVSLNPETHRYERCGNEQMGIYRRGTSYVRIDPDCVSTEQQFIVLAIHELGHYLGLSHVCREDNRTSDTCSSVGKGLAIMNPFLSLDHPIRISSLDLLEYERAFEQRCFGRN